MEWKLELYGEYSGLTHTYLNGTSNGSWVHRVNLHQILELSYFHFHAGISRATSSWMLLLAANKPVDSFRTFPLFLLPFKAEEALSATNFISIGLDVQKKYIDSWLVGSSFWVSGR